MGPQNGIVGGDPYGTQVPQTQIDDSAFEEVQKSAKFSKTKEYKQLEEYWNKRIEFYQTYLPDGRPAAVVDMTDAELGARWRQANVIIGEIEAQKSVYETANEEVKARAAAKRQSA